MKAAGAQARCHCCGRGGSGLALVEVVDRRTGRPRCLPFCGECRARPDRTWHLRYDVAEEAQA
jgi:hypothetical protein